MMTQEKINSTRERMFDWYCRFPVPVYAIGYNGCRNCKHQIEVLRACEWLESGGDGAVHLICPKWEKREVENE